MGEAAGDAIACFDPKTRRFVEIRLPTADALIRHLDVDPETGAVWGAYSPAPPINPKIVRVELRRPCGAPALPG